jgi:hypothetical protein
MSEAYQTDERVLGGIIHRNVKCRIDNSKLDIRIYYKSKNTSNLIMKNNLTKKPDTLQTTNVIYEYSCPEEDCQLLQNMKYIGMTTTTLSRRLTCHLTSGAPKQHMLLNHDILLTRRMLVTNTKIISKYYDRQRLAIGEALHIFNTRPVINLQNTGMNRVLKLFTY